MIVCFCELSGAVCCWPESLHTVAHVYQCFTAGHGSCFTVAVSCRRNPSSMSNHFQEQRKQIPLHKGREGRSKNIPPKKKLSSDFQISDDQIKLFVLHRAENQKELLPQVRFSPRVQSGAKVQLAPIIGAEQQHVVNCSSFISYR